ncbi:hypothetical protein PsorP6_015364 [Peronosclerospora sorghi]|uniref:Uncharacterized protein n=1 Tax=Peronosclerospora sorghi TaxID=230839 RepID=A0ACC0WPL9_9STRA|nr:hypothetical protein PsorP6_015364 [Peronosclerospora sorghi]
MSTEMKTLQSVKQYALIAMTLILIPICLLQIVGVMQMRSNNKAFEDTPGMPGFTDLLIGGAFSLGFIGLRFIAVDLFVPLGRVCLSPEKRVNEERVSRFATMVFKFLFFVCISIAGFYVMRDEPWFIPALGGKGELVNVLDALPYPPSNSLKYYFMVQLGYHLHSLLFMLFFSPIRNDFVEMLLHHLVTLILIGGSYLANYTTFGALVVFAHDLGDIVGYAIKAIVDTGCRPLLVLVYGALLVSWAYTRLYVFPYRLVYIGRVTLQEVQPDFNVVYTETMIITLSLLIVLHVYWYFLFLVMGYVLVSKGVAEDIQQKVEDPKKED